MYPFELDIKVLFAEKKKIIIIIVEAMGTRWNSQKKMPDFAEKITRHSNL